MTVRRYVHAEINAEESYVTTPQLPVFVRARPGNPYAYVKPSMNMRVNMKS